MNPTEAEDSFLTVAEVAGMLKLNQQTVRNWIDQGSLPALRVGRRVRIKRSDFDRVLADAYTAGATSGAQESGPSAEDFWGGGPVGLADAGLGPDDATAPDGAITADGAIALDGATARPDPALQDG
jgi:excisionase family DNA binding protein